MFDMLVSGKIMKVTALSEKQDRDWCCTFTLQESYFDKEPKSRVYVVWCPRRLASRCDALLQAGKYIGVKVADYRVDLDFNADNPSAYLTLKAAAIFIL